MTERDQKIQKLFKENNIHYGWGWNLDDELEVEVMHGDWKHDHAYIDCFMREHGYEKTGERYCGSPTGDDSYSAVHIYALPKEGSDAQG